MRHALRLAAVLGLLVAWAAPAGARPTYFANLRTVFGIPEDSRIDACGVCHKLWTGTGARNDFGTAVEQQLYTGKSIVDSLHAVELDDTDGDGFTNVDELGTYLTLPGYNCDNFGEAVGAPVDYHTYITPLVATCLPPLDILTSPTTLSFLIEAGSSESFDVTVRNYGAELPLHVASYGLAPGAPPTLTVQGPPVPLDIPVGDSVTLTVTFAPAGAAVVSTSLRIVSDDPDTPTLGVPISGIAFVKQLAPPDARAACRESIERASRKYARTTLEAWLTCGVAEGSGVACRRGKRDQAIARAEAKLRRAVGGDRDKQCAGQSLTPVRLDFPATCGGSCGSIVLNGMAALADCLVCRHDDAVARTLLALLGTTPPDLPATAAASDDAARCLKKVAKAFGRASDASSKTLGACALANITADAPTDCITVDADELVENAADVNETFAACTDTTGLRLCPLVGEEPDPACLGTEAVVVGAELADIAYDTR